MILYVFIPLYNGRFSVSRLSSSITVKQCIFFNFYKQERTIKAKLPLEILYERPRNYDWSNRAFLVDQQEEGKEGRKQTN